MVDCVMVGGMGSKGDGDALHHPQTHASHPQAQVQKADLETTDLPSRRLSSPFTSWTDISSMSPAVSPDPYTTEHYQQSGGSGDGDGDGGNLLKSSSMVSFCHSLYEDEDPQMSMAVKQCKRCQFLEARAALTERMNQLSARRPPRVPSPYPVHTWDEDSLASSELTVVSSLSKSQSSSPSRAQAGVQKAEVNACDLQSALNYAAKTALFGVCIPLAGPHDASAFSVDVTIEPSLPSSLWRSIVVSLPPTKTLYLVAITSNNLLEMVSSHGSPDKLRLHLAINYRCGVDGTERVLLPCPLILSLPQFLMGAYDPPFREAGADTMLRWTVIAGAVNPRMLSLRPATSARHSPSFGSVLQLLLHDSEAGRPRSFQRWAWIPRGFLTGCCIRVHEGDDHPLLQLLVPPKLLPVATKCLLSESLSEQTGLCLSKYEPKVVSRAKDLEPRLHPVLLALLEEVRRTAGLLKTVIGEIMRERVPLATDITPLVNTLTAADTLSDWRARATANDLNWALFKATLLKEKSRLAQLACARQRSDALMQRFCLG
ncbi:hypothetical protein AAHC03_020937 [Spirometra sp. Aus1]